MLSELLKRSLYTVGLIIGLQLGLVNKSHGQFNVKIGYSLGILSAKHNNEILNAYNTRLTTLYDNYTPFNDLRLVYGINLGMRYKFGLGSLELSWEGLGRTLSSVGINNPEPPLQPSAVTEEFSYNLNQLMVTYETNFERFGIGSAIGKNFLSIKKNVPNGNEKLPLIDNGTSQYIARFHISFNFYGSETVAFSIKPFIQLGISEADLSSLITNLKVENPNTQEGFPLWGFSFAFYNGRQ